MTTTKELDDDESLCRVFDRLYKEWDELELAGEDGKQQEKILATLKGLEKVTLIVSQLGLFGVNEVYEELEPSHLRFMLTPLMSARLLLKLRGKDRGELLDTAEIFLKDFLVRLKLYEVIQAPLPFDSDSEHQSTQQTSKGVDRSSADVVVKDTKLREEAILRHKQEKELESQFSELQMKLNAGTVVDEDVQREMYLSELKLWAVRALNELKFVEREIQLVAMGKESETKGDGDRIRMAEKPASRLKPFILTRTDAQKKVFGAGYPALATLTVEEWYRDKMANEAAAGHNHGASTETPQVLKPHSLRAEEEQEDEETRRLRAYDEYQDSHRTGWGNTYNQG